MCGYFILLAYILFTTNVFKNYERRIKNMFFKKKTKKQLNNKSVVISTNFSTLDKYEYLTGRDCLKYEITICDYNNKIYKIISKTTEFGFIEVEVFDANYQRLINVNAFGKIKEDNKTNYFILDRIGNAGYNKIGLGHFMMQAIIYLLAKYEELYDIKFGYIKGTLGISGNDLPEKSIPFYKTFDNFQFNETKYLHLHEETLNIVERQILYLIA